MKKFIIIVSLLLAVNLVFGQEKRRFEQDVKTIKEYDKIYVPQADPILFVGSSSIRKWGHLQTAFGNYNVLNRGIGGAVIDDIIYYADDLIVNYKPRQVVIYVGENDLPNEQESADTILHKTQILFNTIRAKLPDIPIVYIAMKPSPVRDKYQDKCQKVNEMIRGFLATQSNVKFIDVFKPMLKDGKSRPEFFLSDMLHMKPEGYAIWEKAVKPALLKPAK